MSLRLKAFSILFAGISWVSVSYAQTCDSNFLGTKTLYHAPKGAAVKIPTGYEPVFINYVGRHGARHLTKSPESSYAYRLLQQADSSQALTPTGLQLKRMVMALQKVEKGKTKSISAEGRAELQGIAGRLYAANQPVFAGKPKVDVTITKEVRTRQSADAFVQQLQTLAPQADVVERGVNDTTLRFYDLSPAYTQFEDKGNWTKAMVLLQQQKHISAINQQVAARFFKADFLKKLSTENQSDFTNDVFGFATIVHSLAAEIKEAGYSAKELDFSSLFTCQELNTLAYIDQADDYLKKGPGTNTLGLPIKIAAPLLADLVKTTDAYLNGSPVKAQLHFAHAETVSPLATLLGMEPAAVASKNIIGFNQHWQASAIIPLSANIAWVLYKNTKGNYLIQFLLNERPVKIIGLQPSTGSFYQWIAVRKFYLNRLAQIGASINMNGRAYLESIK
ncbi:histidine phosphatase family protein [Mucilaginibacter robiniae]|uniref:Multiple inositol polyphosphate phosphatase 1 n=1 Tax=Mucilaginibacter robiniae TaxID=2728022 RepID=A0A7L5E7H8_9SPHI|nr:histidine-type phosphatase [Mucilaginibacter robiniae]QJD96326.1 histidine phosphatase family protein [Mucilaginibacter robiniae]